MPIALVAVAAVSLGLSVYQTVDAKKKQEEAEEEAKKYDRQKLKNPYEDIQTSTRGSDLQQESINNQVATAIESLKSGGSRTILGGIPTLYDNIIKSNQQVAANLDQQENQNQRLEAEGNSMVQEMIEQREKNDLLGIGNSMNVARQQYNQGITSTLQSATALGSAVNNLPGSDQVKPTQSNTTASAGRTGIFGKDAVAMKQPNYNSNPIVNTPQISVNPPLYSDLLDQFNRYQRRLYGIR